MARRCRTQLWPSAGFPHPRGDGPDLTDGEWMVTTGDGLMIACSIGYLAKRSAFNDWLIFSEKFSVPGVLGRTSAAADTPEAIAMEEATQAFGHDWCAVITGDDGTHAEPIKIIQAEGNPAGMPMPAVIERVDRRMAALYRGADLSSMSSGPSGEGTGASLQEKETDILRRDDAETIAETLEEISRLVIEWYFGNGVEPLARVELVVPVQEDSTKVIGSATQLADRGAKVSSSALMNRLNLPKAKDEADALQPRSGRAAPGAEAPVAEAPKEDLANSEVPGYPDDSMQAIRSALAADLQPLGDALFSAYQTGDLAAMTAALKKISKGMPELAGDAAALSEVLSGQMVGAFLGGESEEVENAGNSDGARRGWETRRANGWVAAPRLITPDEADAQLDKGFFVANQDGERIRFGAELKRKLDEKVMNDADRNARKQRLRWAVLAVEAGTSESSRKHGNIRTLYAKTFRKGPKHQDVEVIVDTINGYAWNIMVKGGSPDAIR